MTQIHNTSSINLILLFPSLIRLNDIQKPTTEKQNDTKYVSMEKIQILKASSINLLY